MTTPRRPPIDQAVGQKPLQPSAQRRYAAAADDLVGEGMNQQFPCRFPSTPRERSQKIWFSSN
jgi:hypothetical protein